MSLLRRRHERASLHCRGEWTTCRQSGTVDGHDFMDRRHPQHDRPQPVSVVAIGEMQDVASPQHRINVGDAFLSRSEGLHDETDLPSP